MGSFILLYYLFLSHQCEQSTVCCVRYAVEQSKHWKNRMFQRLMNNCTWNQTTPIRSVTQESMLWCSTLDYHFVLCWIQLHIRIKSDVNIALAEVYCYCGNVTCNLVASWLCVASIKPALTKSLNNRNSTWSLLFDLYIYYTGLYIYSRWETRSKLQSCDSKISWKHFQNNIDMKRRHSGCTWLVTLIKGKTFNFH